MKKHIQTHYIHIQNMKINYNFAFISVDHHFDELFFSQVHRHF